MKKRKQITLGVLLSLLCLSICAFAATFDNSRTTAVADTFDSTSWHIWNDSAITATADGNIYCGSGQMYSTSKFPAKYDAVAKTMTVAVEFSFVKNPYSSHQWMPMLSSTAITKASDYKDKLGTVDSLIGFRCYYYNDANYAASQLRIAACAGNGNWKNDFYTTAHPFSPTDNAKHILYWIMDANGVYAKLDDDVIVAKGTTNPYYFVKSNGNNYTVNDFLVGGEPSVYFAIDGAYQYKTTIYKSAVKLDSVAFDATKWNTWQGDAWFSCDEDGAMTVSAANYYKDNLSPVNYDAAAQTMSVNIDFSVNALNQISAQLVPLITSEPITDWQISYGRIGTASTVPTIAARLYYASDWRWDNDSTYVRICDYKNYSTKAYGTMDPTDEAKHTLSFVMTATNVTMKFDGVTITADGSTNAYQCKKDADTLYTINDFLVDGQPSVYFGVLANSEYGTVKILNNSFEKADFVASSEESLVTSGAAIRMIEPTGLRFLNSVSPSYYNYLATAIGEEEIEMGTLMIPEDLLGSDELTLETTDALIGTRTKWFDDCTRSFYATLTQIPQTKYSETIVARAYMKFNYGGIDYKIYSNAIKRSVEQVATAALEDYDKETVASATDPAVRENENGYIYLITMNGGETYFYSKYTQEQIDVLSSFCPGGL